MLTVLDLDLDPRGSWDEVGLLRPKPRLGGRTPLCSPCAWECGHGPSLEVPWLGPDSPMGCVSGSCECSAASLWTPFVAWVLQRPDDRFVDGSDVFVVEA